VPTGLKSDAGLLHAFRAGDDSAFEELVRRHGSRLRRQCARIVGPDDAEDAVQNALLSASRALRAGDEDVDVGRWLHRVAHNAAIDALRRRPPAALELDEQIDGVPQPPDVAGQRESLRDTVSAIQQLPDAQRRALLLSVFEDNSWEEIARELGTGEGAVRGLLHRARSGMRAAVALAVFPFFFLRAHGARAAVGSMGTTTKAGVVVVLAGAAGGTTAVVLTHHHHHHRVLAPVIAAAPAPHLEPHHHTSGRSASSHSVHRSPGHRGRVVHHSAAATPPAPTQTPAPVENAPQQTPAPTPTTPADATPAQTTASLPPADTTPAQPATTPSNPPAPSTVARIDGWSGGSTNNPGTLHVIFDDGRDVTGYVTGDGTATTCDYVHNGEMTSRSACSMSDLAAGQRVVQASYHALSSGQEKFDSIEVIIPS
jgi:RNA polymerase sigma-70 factor (ECF subfamily)